MHASCKSPCHRHLGAAFLHFNDLPCLARRLHFTKRHVSLESDEVIRRDLLLQTIYSITGRV